MLLSLLTTRLVTALGVSSKLSHIPNLLRSLLLRLPSLDGNRIPDLIRNPRPSSPSSKYHHAHVCEREFADVERCYDRGERYAASALDVVVEACYVRLVALKNAPSVGDAEVLATGEKEKGELVAKKEMECYGLFEMLDGVTYKWM